jgi:hypothetical protein
MKDASSEKPNIHLWARTIGNIRWIQERPFFSGAMCARGGG